MASSDLSDEDFFESLGISLGEVDLMADADTHASMTGIFAQTWAFEYFPYTRPELLRTDPGSGLAPLAWRWYKSNLHITRRKKSLKELRAFFDTCPLEQAEVGSMAARLQSWIQADPDFQRSDVLSQRRVVLSHPILRRYYLGERVDFQIRGCRSVPYAPPEDMRAGKQMILTATHTEGIPYLEFIMGGDYDEFCRISLMPPIGSRFDDFQEPVPSRPLGTRSSRASGPSTRTPRRRPMTDPTSSTPTARPSRAGPSRLVGPFRAPRAILEATGPLHPDLANLRLPYSVSHFVPHGPPTFREVSLEGIDRTVLPSEDITEDPGFGDLRLCPMVLQMEDMGCIGGIVLAETIRSLDRAALGFDNWTVSPIILQKGSITQVWLKDHLQVVTAPSSSPYNPSQYRMRRILISHPTIDAWTSWLIELGPNEILWFISWYNITRFIQVSFRHTRVYLLGFTHCTWYCASRVLRQMGIDQTVPIMDDFSADSAITPGVTRAVLRAWVRDHRMVRPLPNPATIQTSPEYRSWFITTVWPIERPRRTALLSILEGWVQADADDEIETGEEIMLTPQTDVAGHSLTARADSEEVAPRRRRDI
ncbi:hypothetical protein JCGZ_02872 [Jatropha curcas]|uniref:Aminotransferase-like plant mobile domain-containing protein n=1 Tax=Jatropha curcas TaxID=180498 RepID=A0A067L1R4_JATCU|nr:hypothetical protein JCGZ_02872 [Jatropha curcas]